VAAVEAAGPAGMAAWRDHVESRGRIDGKRHRAPKRLTADRTVRASDSDWESARAAVAAFPAQPATWVPDMHAMHEERQGKVWLQPRESWDMGLGETDFITTLRQSIHHEPMTTMPSKNPNTIWPVGTLSDAPHASAEHELRFCSQKPDTFHISSMPERFIIRHDEGTMLWHGEVPVGARAMTGVGRQIRREMIRAYYEVRKLRRYCARGGMCAAIARCAISDRTRTLGES
jgi:hypothetical protein